MRPRILAVLVLTILAFAIPSVGSSAELATADLPAAVGTPAPGGAAGVSVEGSLTWEGQARYYRVFVPTTPAANPGLLVALHNNGADRAKFEAMKNLDREAGANGNYVVFPQGISNTWNAKVCCRPATDLKVDDVGFLDAVINRVLASYALDPRRIAMTGASAGGIMTYRFACETRAAKVSTFVPVVGTAAATAACSSALPRRFRMLAINGAADTFLPWEVPAAPSTGVKAYADRFKQVAGCAAGWSVVPRSGTTLTQYVAPSCPSNMGFTELLGAKLDHRWPVGAKDLSTYGLDATVEAWSYINSVWAQTDPGPLTTPGPIPAETATPTPTATPTGTPSATPTPTPTTPAVISNVVVGAPRPAPGGAAGTSRTITMSVDAASRQFILFTPTKPAAKAGLVVVPADWTVTAAATETATDLDLIAGQKGHYVAYAQGLNNGLWNAGPACCALGPLLGMNDLGYLDGVIATARAHATIDPSRTAVGGLGAGGVMAAYYACRGRNPVNVLFGTGSLTIADHCSQLPTRVLQINGLKDGLYLWDKPNTNLVLFSRALTSQRALMDDLTARLGCQSTWSVSVDPSNKNEWRKANGCRPDVTVEQHVVPWLDHRWTSKSSDWTPYGMNSTKVTWDYINRFWT